MKEVRWELDKADEIKRATILALAHFFRIALLSEIGIPHELLDRPLDYTRDDLMRFYSGIEDLRNGSNMQFTQSKKVSKRIGFEMPAFLEEHTKNCSRGLEVWMCTVGAGVQPQMRDEARAIWNHLSSSSSSLPAAINRMLQIEARVAEMSGTADAMFSDIATDEWIEACAFVPSIFVAELKGWG
ncbi:hypothetical protein [Mesorhizobium sp.]|uniref:hypothetical protein n=1 Tax=Mesorhizobium sp. TaxID=1871066 RepID=UPI0012109168|nr:hypothetical protein [Mesorhizobium sp.]TIO29001.1 MAG: hypothetical protein E5X89_32720 [Mesorhizobium sp.]